MCAKLEKLGLELSNLKLQHVWFHTSAASPYRRHLFESVAAEFPNSKFFFTLHDGDPWLKYQAWNVSADLWKIKKVNLRLRVPVPRFAFIHLDYLWHLLFQPKGTIHFVGCVQGNGWLILLSCLLRHSFYVAWSDGGFADSLSPRPASIFKRFMLRHTSAGFIPGQRGRLFFEKWGIPSRSIFNAFFSHDIDEFKTFYVSQWKSSRESVRRSAEIPNDAFVVLCVARLLDWKRIEDLAEALLNIDTARGGAAEQIHFVLIGDGTWNMYRQFVGQFKHVRFHYYKRVEYEDIKGWFCAADVFGFPSEGDIWGLVVNEALSLGLPVICTERIGAAELIRHGWNGYVTSVRAPEEIKNAILEMFDNPKCLQEMRGHAVEIWHDWNSRKALEEIKRLVQMVTQSRDVPCA